MNHPLDQYSEDISRILFDSWVEEVRHAKHPNVHVWRYAWIRCWPTIRDKIAEDVVRATHKVPKPEPWAGILFTIISVVCSRPVLIPVVLMAGVLLLVMGVSWEKSNAKADRNPDGGSR